MRELIIGLRYACVEASIQGQNRLYRPWIDRPINLQKLDLGRPPFPQS